MRDRQSRVVLIEAVSCLTARDGFAAFGRGMPPFFALRHECAIMEWLTETAPFVWDGAVRAEVLPRRAGAGFVCARIVSIC